MKDTTLVPMVAFVMVAVAGLVLADDCDDVPYDGSAENGFGVAPGSTMEYCGQITADPGCTIEGWCYPSSQGTAFTRTGGVIELPIGSTLRPCMFDGTPGPSLSEQSATATGIPPFPSFTESKTCHFNELEPVTGCLFSCARWNGDDGPGVFATADRSATTPPNSCYAMDIDTGYWEQCTDADPSLRAVGLSGDCVPFRSSLEGSNVVPPDPTTEVGVATLTWDSTFEVDGTMKGPVNLSFRVGEAGTNGPIVLGINGVELPYVGNFADLMGPYFPVLRKAKVHVEITQARGATIRGALMPANLVFADGFERGDTGNW